MANGEYSTVEITNPGSLCLPLFTIQRVQVGMYDSKVYAIMQKSKHSMVTSTYCFNRIPGMGPYASPFFQPANGARYIFYVRMWKYVMFILKRFVSV